MLFTPALVASRHPSVPSGRGSSELSLFRMLSSLSTVLATACLIVQTLASPTSGRTLSNRQDSGTPAAPIPPLQDPWYSAPDGFESAKPGDVLRIRQAPGNLTSLASNCSSAYNILYRTTNSQYKPDWAVTTVFVPVTPSPALLSYQIPYDSAWLDASPSYAFYTSDGTRSLRDVSTGLSSGWFVNVPDYEGPLASFTAGVMSGHATIDSIRAAFNANETLGLDVGARYAMWGYSGGALASEWAAELQVQYAPEASHPVPRLFPVRERSSSRATTLSSELPRARHPLALNAI